MNNSNISRLQSSDSKQEFFNNEEQIRKNIKKLYKESLRRVVEYGAFSKVKVNFVNKDKNLDIKNIELSIKPSILLDERPKERELEISVQSSINEKNIYKLVLKRGQKEEILKFLQSEDILKKIDKSLKDASEAFLEL